MIEASQKFAGATDDTTTLPNDASDLSDGVRGDGKKVGGTRIDLDKLCGPSNKRCVTNEDGSLKLNVQGQVQFDVEKAGMSLSEFLKSDEGKKSSGPTGGIQGWEGTLFGKPYQAGSWQDKLIEAFSGTHDFVGGSLSGLYDEQGNIKRGMTDTEQSIYDNLVTTTAIVPATPFAMAEFLPPQVWQAISILLKGAK